ncbi:unnamed protein product [Cylindrotheca closterium]|uniref:protein-tyrosine-phosphatase n=1 Tax=Cylindrotheca closterium TaxID=2856 RepID=A0AAD2FUM1_9STRA|nr:unnamed protein product [Cylindrotheca closterium]
MTHNNKDSLQRAALRNYVVLRTLGCQYQSRPEVVTSFVEPTLFGHAHEVYQSEPSGNKIYLGPQSVASKEALDALQDANIAAIVNCTSRGPLFHMEGFKYSQVNVHDNSAADILRYLEGAALFLHAMLGKGSVLVHCEYGVSRSSTVVIAYLMRYQSMTRDEAYVLVKKRRPKVNPNQGFWDQLASYEQTIKEIIQNPTPWKSDENSNMDYRTWIEMSQALYATCHDVEGVLASHPCWQLLTIVCTSSETLNKFLFACLDFLWGRGLRDVDLEWLDYVIHSFPEESEAQVQQLLRCLIEDPESEFRDAWSGEIRKEQIEQICQAVLKAIDEEYQVLVL